MVETLEQGRDAIERHAWTEAVDVFAAADAEDRLGAEDLERLGTAAWWAGEPDKATEAQERAFAGYEDAGRSTDAARVALTLAYQAFRREAVGIGAGWQARAQRLLDAEPDSPGHARLALFNVIGALFTNQIDESIELADHAMALAQKHGDRDANFMAMSFKGIALVQTGDLQGGFALIDEAATAASSGKLDLRVSSDIYCNTIAACRNAGDLKRAAQWADEGERWMKQRSLGGYPGICRVHRAELKMLRGLWPEAEQEARQACDELGRYGLVDGVAWAHYMIGEIRLRMGDFDAAGEAFDQAYELGHPAQPGMALLQLARGEVEAARHSIDRALLAAVGRRGQSHRTLRARLLPAQVDIALAAGDLETAGTAVTELEAIAVDFQRPVFEAGALTGRGELLLGESRPSEASPILGRSWRLWLETDLPYESAKARLRYAEALAAEGEEATARRDLQAARKVFERLGARAELSQVDALLGEGTPSQDAVVRAARTFMFTDIVTSTDLVGLIGDEAWGELLRWHDRELRSAFASHRGEEIKQTGDGFFVAFERVVDGLECAVDIQRRLARHRREHGFAPWVRIGLHAAEASRHGRDYQGRGVHVAARIGAAAAREEVLVSSTTVAALGSTHFGLSEPRTLSLKGVEEPVEVVTVNWR